LPVRLPINKLKN